MDNVIEYYQKNRMVNFVFGVTWLILGSILFISFDEEFSGLLMLAFVFLIIAPSLVVLGIALRNKLRLNKANNTLTIRSLLNERIILIDDIVDIKFPKYAPMHIKNSFKRALYDNNIPVPFIACYIIEENNPDGLAVPFKSFGEKEFRSILDYLKSINKKVSHIEYPPNDLL